jgi:prolyl oligopeptidase
MVGHFQAGSRRAAGWRRGKPLLLVAMALSVVATKAADIKSPPSTKRGDVVDDYHGVKVADPYRWLEDQQSPATRAWIAAQNSYTRSFLDRPPGRQELEHRLAQLMRVDQTGLPRERGGRCFFSKRRTDQDLFVIYMREGLEGQNEALIDPHSMSPDHTTSVVMRDVSEDGKEVVYGVRQGGQDETSIRFFDVDAREDLSDQLPKARYESVSLTRDKSVLFYSLATPKGPRVYSHKMGTRSAEDTEIFGERYGPDKIIGTTVSEDGRYLVIYVLYGSAADQTEVYFQDLANRGPITPVVTDIAARFFGEVADDTLFLQTNWQAPNNRIIAVDLRNLSRDQWRTVVPEGDAVISDFSLAGGRLFINYLKDAHSKLSVFGPEGHKFGDVELPALGTVEGISGEWKSQEAFFAFSSFHVPPTIFHTSAKNGTLAIWAQAKVPIDSSKISVRQVWYTSKDGTKVPMFLLYNQGLKLDGSNPTLLTGYGGFDLNETPTFSARAVLWVERGGVFAVPNLRGGGEFGENWHQAGMFGKKQNVFDDFIAAGHWLIKNGYTKPSKLSILGTSNGGLLVGAALTERPDLFQAVVCRYPLLDMLRYQNFLVARFWVSEYGSSENPEQFKYLAAYSPYQNVKRGTKYPAVLLVSGDGDTRVAPLHARKMAAKLQWATASDRPVLLLYDTKSGHSGGRPLSRQIEELTDEMSFLFWQLGNSPTAEKTH